MINGPWPGAAGFSQGGEDLLLRHIFGRVTHTYVDVGAFDGVHLSNTYLLELMGWTGVCIEANPEFTDRLRQARPRSRIFACAAGGKDGQSALAVDATGLRSTLEPNESWERQAARAAQARGVEPGVHKLSVEVQTLDTMLTRASVMPPIGVVSIDVEGAESLVLDGFTIEAWRPLVIVLEGNSGDERDEHAARLSPHGYRLVRRLGVNEFYASKADIGRELEDADVTGVLLPTEHPYGSSFVHPDLREARTVRLRPRRSSPRAGRAIPAESSAG